MTMNNHIGQKNWNRLTPGQKRHIIKNRQNARKILEEIKKNKEKHSIDFNKPVVFKASS